MTQLVPQQQKVATVRELIDRSKQQIMAGLPKQMDVTRFTRVVMTNIQTTPELLDCKPISLISAILQSAQLGLEPDNVLGRAYLVPYKNTVVLIVGYKGFIELARRSGMVNRIEARVVYEKDAFDFKYGTDQYLTHTPNRDTDPGPMLLAYALAEFKDHTIQFDVLQRRDIEKIKKQSPAAQKGPWKTHEDEMWKKTAIRRLAKILPAAAENEALARAVALDERAEAGITQGAPVGFDADSITERGNDKKSNGKLGDLTEKLKNGKGAAAEEAGEAERDPGDGKDASQSGNGPERKEDGPITKGAVEVLRAHLKRTGILEDALCKELSSEGLTISRLEEIPISRHQYAKDWIAEREAGKGGKRAAEQTSLV